MSKKLLTSDVELITKVENVLKENGIPSVKVPLTKEKDKNMLLLVVTNRNGEAMRKAIAENSTADSKYYFGVLRNHPEYAVPRDLMTDLAQKSYGVVE